MTMENNNNANPSNTASPASKFSPSTPPNAESMRQANGLAVLDEQGKKVNFKELYSGTGGKGGKTIVLVIRHFYCGLCRTLQFQRMANGIDIVALSRGFHLLSHHQDHSISPPRRQCSSRHHRLWILRTHQTVPRIIGLSFRYLHRSYKGTLWSVGDDVEDVGSGRGWEGAGIFEEERVG